jgi:hypothetical protein
MWRYEQETGKLFHVLGGESIYVATGYSGGNKGRNPEGVNNAADESIPDIGPIPVGTYRIGTPIGSPTPVAMPLLAFPSNEMFGRSGFMMHGDSIEGPGCASEGCIIMSRAVRQAVADSAEVVLEVF